MDREKGELQPQLPSSGPAPDGERAKRDLTAGSASQLGPLVGSEYARAENEDDDGYDPWSDRPPSPEPLFERDPWS